MNSSKLLYKTAIINYLTVQLKRAPTEDEIIAEGIRCGCAHMLFENEAVSKAIQSFYDYKDYELSGGFLMDEHKPKRDEE